MKHRRLSDKEFAAIVGKVMSDPTPLAVDIDMQSAWLLVSFLQLASRHPHMTQEMQRRAIKLGQHFAWAIVSAHPEAETAIQMGWNRSNDR